MTVRRMFKTFYDGKLALLLGTLALLNLAGNEGGYSTDTAAICEDCEKELTGGITFSPATVNVWQDLEASSYSGETTATFDKGTANWSLAELPQKTIVSQVDFSPRVNTGSTKIKLWGYDQMWGGGKGVDLPTKLGVTATPTDPKQTGGTRWLSINGKAPWVGISSSFGWTPYTHVYRPTISPGQTLTVEIEIENSPSWRKPWDIQVSCEGCGAVQRFPDLPYYGKVPVTIPANYWDQVVAKGWTVDQGRSFRIEVHCSSSSGTVPFSFIHPLYLNVQTDQKNPPVS